MMMRKIATSPLTAKSRLFASCAIAFCALASTVMLIAPTARAQQAGEAVAATVNDAMISTFDVRQRTRLMILTSGGRIPESAYPQMQSKALRDLIEEKLKLQEAERLEFAVDQAEVDDEFATIAGRVKLSPRQLSVQLLDQGIAPETLKSQIRSRLVWRRLVATRYRSRVRITDEEIERTMTQLLADSRSEQFLISEICLPIEAEGNSAEIYDAGLKIVDQMRQGVPFDALAREFSACTSAATGGDLGWMRLSDIPEELANVVENLQEGNVSVPTPHDGMMHIMAVRQKRAPTTTGTATYQVAYAGAPLSIGEQTARDAFSRLKQTNACAGDELSVDLGPNIGVTALPPLPAEAMQPAFRGPVAALERGEISDLIVTNNAYHALLLCEKDEGLGLPSRTVVEDKLFADELELVSRRYLRDIERDSSVDIKVTGDAAPANNG